VRKPCRVSPNGLQHRGRSLGFRHRAPGNSASRLCTALNRTLYSPHIPDLSLPKTMEPARAGLTSAFDRFYTQDFGTFGASTAAQPSEDCSAHFFRGPAAAVNPSANSTNP